ncbi:hypothetical protein ACP4OV_012283 [Aristida adscensionis]
MALVTTSPSLPRHKRAKVASRRPLDSLLVATVYDAADLSRAEVRLLDTASGAVVARLDGLGDGGLGVCGDLLCLVGAGGAAVRVINPATGAVTEFPGRAAAHGARPTSSAFVFGHVPATGEYKVLCVYAVHGKPGQSCDVVTLAGGEQCWRPAQSPPMCVEMSNPRSRAVTQGVAHFLSPNTVESDSIASFDLDKEEWRPTLIRGPLSGEGRHCCRSQLSLAELNGYLVMVHHNFQDRSMDLYFLSDPVTGTWSGKNSLSFTSILRDQERMARPLMMLVDGSIVFWVAQPNGTLRVYNPSTGACKDVAQLGKTCSIVGAIQKGHFSVHVKV